MRLASRLATLLLLAESSACGPYIDEVNAQHRAKVEPKLVEIAAVQKLLATPALETDKAPPEAIRIVLSKSWSAEGNSALLYAEDFASFDELGFVYARLPNADLVQRASAALHTEHAPWDPARPDTTPGGAFGSDAGRTYALLEKLQYVTIVRTRAFAKPLAAVVPAEATPTQGSVDGGVSPALADAGKNAAPSENKHAYSGGYLAAELLFVRIAGPELLGGIRFEAESSDRISGPPSEAALEQDLRTNIRTAVKDALAKRAPSAQVSER